MSIEIDRTAPNKRMVCPEKLSSASRCESGRGKGQAAA